jgi:molybdopterin-dependent oxidoreductase alpha subunit
VAFLSGALKALGECGGIDRSFIAEHTVGFEKLESRLAKVGWETLEQSAGADRARMREFADLLKQARNAVFVWSMGLTQHAHGVDNVRALVNLALARGYVGRPLNGLMPIRGHSGVQGGAEVGCVPGHLPGGANVGSEDAQRLSHLWGFAPPREPGLSAGEMLEASGRGEIDVLYSVGGNFLDTLPDREGVRRALSRVPIRVHQDIVVSSQMLVEPGEVVVLLPARTRYEQTGGGTETTTERRILFSPEVPGRRIGESRSEWEILQDVAERAKPEGRDRIHFDSADAIRREIAAAVPAYVGIQNLAATGDQVQYGGPRLYEGGRFATGDGRAHFRTVEIPQSPVAKDRFRLSTRRGKQFNSMVQGARDPLTGAARDAVLLSSEDGSRLGLRTGDRLLVRSPWGEFEGRAFLVAIRPGNVQVHWPEGNALLPPGARDRESGIPDYNAVVALEPISAPGRRGQQER